MIPRLICMTAALLWAAVLPSPLRGDAPALLFPVDCTLGDTCFLQQFMDRDPGPGWRDFTCGPASYDGHTGTDIRVADLATMRQGWAVRAAAPGTVRAIRDGVPDGGTAAAPQGQGCGNGVVIDHAEGWQTQYCHLAQGSVTVTPGQAVAAGAVLGEIGYSGITEFPHLEFLVRHNGVLVDPFDPSDLSRCGMGVDPLWAEPIASTASGVLSVGFSDAVPEFSDIRAGTANATSLDRTGPALVLWGFVFGGQAGDILRLEIRDPEGAAYHRQEVVLERTQAELFRASGRRISDSLPAGEYTGTVTLIRDDIEIDTRTTHIPVR
ncbi:Peptidase, M23/M37 family [Roseibacterium elongatum DSM 19469]|uniref:Peptidase, M23/M37 family n=1 Tax=Roseicyclus elongatus DSM 19469 TaxID=1294273 RepID=W8S624_9RHOB|nr:M23 family metallopeptidase [Roseibacterium elongatum]AHM04301.1 Peptidase, M23/M37 family [Roseibacterium elongatum DSM 19469]